MSEKISGCEGSDAAEKTDALKRAVDVLGRDGFMKQLIRIIRILSEKKRGCCFGIDGAWGSGKTFVLEKLERAISPIQKEETADDWFYVFHYDCWKYDYYEEPLLAIVIAMLDAVQDGLSQITEEVVKQSWKKAKEKLYEVMGEISKNKIGVDLVKIVDEIWDGAKEGEKAEREKIDHWSGFRKALKKTREEIKEIAKDKTVVIVVDELDRCLPAYSIKVLERLHHIFEGLDNVIVIVAMDKFQLKKSITEIFGEIDVDVYLRKFISFKVDLDKGHARMYARKFEEYFSMFAMTTEESGVIEELFSNLLLGLDMRTQERIFRKAQIIHEMIEDGQAEDCSVMAFEILYLAISLKMKQKDIRWLCNILELGEFDDLRKNEKLYGIEIEKIGKKYFDMLQEYACSGIRPGKRYRDNYYNVDNTVIGKMFFWLSNVFYAYDNGICGKYFYNEQEELLKKDVDRVKQFAELVKIISCD